MIPPLKTIILEVVATQQNDSVDELEKKVADMMTRERRRLTISRGERPYDFVRRIMKRHGPDRLLKEAETAFLREPFYLYKKIGANSKHHWCKTDKAAYHRSCVDADGTRYNPNDMGDAYGAEVVVKKKGRHHRTDDEGSNDTVEGVDDDDEAGNEARNETRDEVGEGTSKRSKDGEGTSKRSKDLEGDDETRNEAGEGTSKGFKDGTRDEDNV